AGKGRPVQEPDPHIGGHAAVPARAGRTPPSCQDGRGPSGAPGVRGSGTRVRGGPDAAASPRRRLTSWQQRNRRRHRVPRPGEVLYIIVCAAGPASDVGRLVTLAQDAGWTVQIVATPSALDFIDSAALEKQTGDRKSTR